MSRIDELIEAMCPEGVPHRRLGEIGTFVRGKRFVKGDFVDSGVPCIHYGEIYTRYGTWASEAHTFLAASRASQLRTASPGDLIIVATGETVEEVCKAVAWLGEGDVVIHDACYAFRHELDPKYASYSFQTAEFKRQVRPLVSRSKVVSILAAGLEQIQIAVPPLAIQREIVSILEKMEGLNAELESELEYRSRQYAYYRDSLLAFAAGERVRWALMGEVGEFIRGRRFTKADVVPVGVGSIHYGEIYTRYGVFASEALSHVRPELTPNLRFARTGDVVIASVGETVEDVCKAVAWLGEEEVAIHDDCFAYRHTLNPKFVAYFFQTSAFHAQKNKYVARAKVKRISGESLAKIKIPVPPMEEQERIVAILDKFDALVNNISVGLPAEIGARRQQYEFYRDRLLTFEEKAQ